MQIKLCIYAIAGVLSLVSAVNYTDTSLESRQDQGCARGVHVIALGGLQTTDGDLGYLSSLAYGIRDSIQGSTLSQIGYPAGADAPTAIGYAVPALRSHIREYSAGCPNSQIVIASYSVGAAISMNTLCGASATGENALPKRFRQNILANIVYGDPTFLPGKRYVVGSCTQAGSVPRQFPGQCFPYGRKTRSYCDVGDVECCSGGDPNVHFTYPDKYDQHAMDFVMRRWNRYQRNRG